MRRGETRTVYGPFHRRLAPGVQDDETVVLQILSGEVWGKPASWGGSPQVKAYHGPLPDVEEVAKLQVAFVRITQDLHSRAVP